MHFLIGILESMLLGLSPRLIFNMPFFCHSIRTSSQISLFVDYTFCCCSFRVLLRRSFMLSVSLEHFTVRKTNGLLILRCFSPRLITCPNKEQLQHCASIPWWEYFFSKNRNKMACITVWKRLQNLSVTVHDRMEFRL